MDKQIITTLNGIEIAAVRDENNNFFVPVKPICQAIGIDFAAQRNKIQADETLGSTMVIIATVASDEKDRDMVCLPLKFIYGWLFTINPGKVAPEAKENVIRYRLECYDALYRHFAGSLRRRVEENEAEIAALKAVNDAILREKEAKADRRKAEEHLQAIRNQRLDPCPSLDLD